MSERKAKAQRRKAQLVFPSPAPVDRYYLRPEIRQWSGLTVNGEPVQMMDQGIGFVPVWGSLQEYMQANADAPKPFIMEVQQRLADAPKAGPQLAQDPKKRT